MLIISCVQVNAAWVALGEAVLENKNADDEDDEDYHDYESDWDSVSYCESDVASDWDSEYDDQGFDRYYDYGDLSETGGRYVVQLDNDEEMSLEEHARTCTCGL